MQSRNVAKVVVVGASGVGKTSIIERSVRGRTNDTYEPTVGTGFFKLSLPDADPPSTFEIWDTAGQERFRSLTKTFFKDAQAALFVFDITRLDTLNELEFYARVLDDIANPGSVVIGLLGNKSDLPDEAQISRSVIQEHAQRLRASFYLATSAHTGEGLDEIFTALLNQPGMRFFDQNGAQVERMVAAVTDQEKCAC
jgi:small GTP-binding protein